jgi:hypothetical protein
MSGNAIKVFYIICHNSDGRFFNNLDTIMEYKITAPTVYKSIGELMKKNVIRKYQEAGKPAVLELQPPYDHYAEHLKAFQGKLKPEGTPQETDTSEHHRNIVEIISYYGTMIGIGDTHKNEWFQQNIGTLYPFAKKLYRYTSNLDKSKKILDNANRYYKAKGISWSMQGALMNNIQIFLKQLDEPKGYRADTPVKKLLCAYKILKGLSPTNVDWDIRHAERAKPHAEHILNRFEGDWEQACNYIEKESKKLTDAKLSFTIQTLADRVMEWNPKETK